MLTNEELEEGYQKVYEQALAENRRIPKKSDYIKQAIRKETLMEVGEWLNRTLKIEDLPAFNPRPSLLVLVNGIQALLKGELPD